jgi:murein DD-endopeptidase MepM/ murein hydrolase activator NlpD
MTKGKERLTIMFIPHSEKKIFNFHISNFTLFAGIIVTSLVITIAIFSIEKQETTYKRQVAYQSANYQIKIQLNKFVKITDDLVKRTQKVKSTLNELFKLTGLSSDNYFIDTRAQGGPAIPVQEENRENLNAEQIKEILELRRVHSDTVNIGDRITRLSKHMRRFKSIADNYPSIWPLNGGGAVSKGFGIQRSDFSGNPVVSRGITIRTFGGTPVRATANGNVVEVGYSKKYGVYAVVKHGYGFRTLYGFLQDTKVRVGVNVKKGDVVGEVGRTGSAIDYSLYYEVQIGNELVDPSDFVSLDNYW